MKDFVSKVTFGFLMSQLFPGATAVYAIGFIYFTWEKQQPNAFIATADHVLRRWGAATTPQAIFLVALCIAAGMFIHGLQWATLGSLEHRGGGDLYRTPWYQQPLWKQILGGPWRILREFGEFLMLTSGITQANMYESVTIIDSRLMPQFDFLGEFYLSVGQFFLHTAYALMMLIGATASYILAYGLTWRRLVVLAIAYGLTGLFFVLGRIQMCSLFEAERALASRDVCCNDAALP
jgi:hypothetical protein